MLIDSLDLISTLKTYLHHWFAFPKSKVFAQVSTLTKQQPHIRTMDLYDFTPKGSLIFLTDTHSPKWVHLKECPNVGVCLLNLEYGQIVVEGTAVLDTNESNRPLVTLYWQNFLDDYWRTFYSATYSKKTSDQIPSSFGVVQIIPKLWQILEINRDDFLQGTRVSYELQDGSWAKNKLPLI
jgi:general stress protein 26